MTMLDRMRRHKRWLQWSLVVVVGTFIFLYVPQFLQPGGAGAAPNAEIASVNGRRITAETFQRVYAQQIAQVRSTYGDVTDQMLRQMGIGERIVQQLVNQEAQLAEAERLGLTVSDGELRERLIRLPMFQQNGQFVGYDVYRQVLNSQRPPVSEAEFEADLRRSLLANKLQSAVTSWIRIADAEVDQEYRRQNEKVKLELAIFTASDFKSGLQATDAEIAAEYNGHPDTYRAPEKRRVKYLSIDADALRSKVVVTPQEVEAYYTSNVQNYSTPEQIRASHILFKTEGKDEAAVRKVAETVLAKVKGGGDFAALAKQYSEDEGSKATGGDLSYQSKGAMVQEFDDVAWALSPGQVSDLVKSQFGFHIIKVVEKRPAATKTLDQVRAQIELQLRTEKAQAEATRISDEIAKEIKSPADLDKVAGQRGLTVGDSGLFARDEPLAGLGFATAVASEAFRLDQGKVSEMLRSITGFAFITVTEIKPAALPPLQEIKDKVRDDVVLAKAVDVARTKAATMAQAGRTNFAAAAKAAGVQVKATDFITRGSALPEIGVSEKIDEVVFGLKAGDTTAPIATASAVVVARVKERQDITPAALATERETVRDQLTQRRRGEFFDAYMSKAREKMDTKYNNDTIGQLLGS